jgi:hypothetical protein
MSALFRTLAAAPLAAAALLFTVASATPAHASVIYTYTGNPFNVLQGNSYSAQDGVAGVMELGTTLGANLSSTSLTPLTFSFSDGVKTITQANASSASFVVSTDGLGNITTWEISLAIPFGVGGPPVVITTTNTAQMVLDRGEDNECFGFLCGLTFGEVRNAPGGWEPKVPPVPEPSSMLLIGAALAGFTARRRLR